jgi:hypothetical protein
LGGAVGEERRRSVVRWERSGGAWVRAEERRSVEKKKKKPPKIGQIKQKKLKSAFQRTDRTRSSADRTRCRGVRSESSKVQEPTRRIR